MMRIDMISRDEDYVTLPEWVDDLESFRRWTDDDAFPEQIKVSYLDGRVVIDMSKEQLFSHNAVKTEIAFALTGLAKSVVPGRFFGDGLFLSNEDANISNQPDGCFIKADTFKQGRVNVVEGKARGYVELEGTPDLVVEVVSDSSVEKDTEFLRGAYAKGGICEYWLIDGRESPLSFELLTLEDGEYVPARIVQDWRFSTVLKHWVRLSQRVEDDGFPSFTLETSVAKPKKA